jgi:type II secretory pathway component PulM
MTGAQVKSSGRHLVSEWLERFWSRRNVREKCLVGAAIGMAIVLILNQFIIEPFVNDQVRVQTDILVQRQVLEKYARTAAARQQWQKRLEELNGMLATLQQRLLGGQTSALAAAGLQDTLQKLANENNVSVQVMRVLQPRSLEIYTGIPVLMEIQTRTPGLSAFLYSIENNQMLLNVAKLNIRVIDLRNPLDIRASLTVEGYTLASKEKSAANGSEKGGSARSLAADRRN